MVICKRDETIARLLSLLDIPQLRFIRTQSEGIGPYFPKFFDESYSRRKEAEKQAETALHEMTDEELWDLSETPGRLESFAWDFMLHDEPPWYAGGFGAHIYRADFEYWAKMDFWSLEEATCLSIGFKPEKIPDYQNQVCSPYETVEFFKKRLLLIQRGTFNRNAAQEGVSPSVFVAWAVKKSLEIPPELKDALASEISPRNPEMLSSIDRRKYDSALKVILGLLSAQFGYRGGPITPEMKADISSGLQELGLSMDRKTLDKVVAEAKTAKKGFDDDQKKRDAKDI